MLFVVLVLLLIPQILLSKPDTPFVAEKISFTSDIPFSKDEFFYLSGLKEGSYITNKDLFIAYKQLKRKKRFYSIKTSLGRGKTGKIVNFHLVSNWIFRQLSLTGIWFDKHHYESLYLQNPGDVFDISLHEESIGEIKKALREKGYFGCQVKNEIIYCTRDKTINIKIHIKKGRAFLIDSVSLHPKSDDIIKKLSSFLIGRRYSKKLISRAHDLLPPTSILERSIKLDKKTVSLFFHSPMHPKPSFDFNGNKEFNDNQIRETIIDMNKPIWLLDPNIVAEQILHAYYARGYWETVITYKKISENHFLFSINEEPKTVVENVIIKDKTLGTEEKNKFFFEPILNAGYYDETILEECKNNLKNFYFRHGFWDFSITDQKLVNKDIILTIEKGVQRFSPDGLPIDPSSIADQRLQIIDDYQKKGFWYADAQPILTSKDNTVSVSWKTSPGKQVRFGKLFLTGDTRVPFRRIMKEIQFKEGDLWDRNKIDYTRKKLKDLDIFKHIELHPQKVSSLNGQKPISLSLIDDNPLTLKLRAGYYLTSKNFLFKRESTPKIGGSIIFKNPLNVADKLSIDADFTRFEKNFDLAYQVPRTFNCDITTKSKVYYYKYIHPLEVGKSDSAYEALQTGFLCGATREYKPHSFWGLNLGNEWMRTYRTRGNLNFSESMMNKTIPYFIVEPNLLIDRLDDRINTKKGCFTFVSLKTMIPFENRSAISKLIVEQSMFYHFGHDVVGAARVRAGHIFNEKFEEIMPIERFYLGGPFSVRGYTKDAVPPLGETIKVNPNGTIEKEYTIQGGSSMFNSNLELRFPMYKMFGGVIFQDIGALSQSGFLSCITDRWALASGFGFRYHTPIGALRFDIGWKWKRSFPTDSPYSWYLTLGQVF